MIPIQWPPTLDSLRSQFHCITDGLKINLKQYIKPFAFILVSPPFLNIMFITKVHARQVHLSLSFSLYCELLIIIDF